jgi:hypothetical protein
MNDATKLSRRLLVWMVCDRGDPEAFFPAFTLVTGLTLRFNAVNYGDPDQASRLLSAATMLLL